MAAVHSTHTTAAGGGTPGAVVHIHLPAAADPATAGSLHQSLQKAADLMSGQADILVDRADRLAQIAVGLAEPNLELLEDRLRRLATVTKVFTEGEWLTAEQVNRLQPRPPQNKSHPASDWKRRGRVFSVNYDGQEYFARYQLDAMYQPLPIVKRVLAAFGEVADPWVLAAWFHYPNGWLVRQDRRQDLPSDLDDEVRDEVNEAVRPRPADAGGTHVGTPAGPQALAPKDALDQGEAVVAAAERRRGSYVA